MPRLDMATRTMRVLAALSTSRTGVPLKSLAERNHWNLRTLYRDVEALEAAGYHVVREQSRYRIVGHPRSPHAQLDGEEIAALFMARQLATGVRVTNLGRALDRLWAKLTTPASGSAPLLPAEAPWMTVRSGPAIDYTPHRHTIAAIERGARERRAVATRYRAQSSGEETQRVIEPGELHWDPRLEALYVIAWCRLRQDVRIFAAHRFVDATLTDEPFAPRATTTSRAALGRAFRVWRDANVRRVRIAFDADAARVIRERRWHPTQELTDQPDGGVELSLQVAGLDELHRWVLSFAGGARALEPPELAELVSASARALLAAAAATGKARRAAPRRSPKPALPTRAGRS